MKFYLNGKNILDAGCEVGDFSFYLADKGASVIGIDVDGPKIEIANEIARLYAKDAFVKFFCKNLMEIETSPAESYDGIVCLGVLEHIENDEDLLMRFYNILNDGGFLILNTPTSSRKIVKEKEIEDNHVRCGYSEKQLKQMLMHVGFVIKAVFYSDSLGLYFYFNKISNMMPTTQCKKIFSALLFPFFFILITISDVFVTGKGSELTLIVQKKSNINEEFPR